MHIPIDPSRVNGLWDKLKSSLIKNKHAYLIQNGEKNSSVNNLRLNASQADQLIARLMKANYVRLGASKMLPVPPHFAIECIGKIKGNVIELITIDGDKNTIKNAIELIIQFAFFELKEMVELEIPFYTHLMSDSEFDITFSNNNEGLIVKKR